MRRLSLLVALVLIGCPGSGEKVPPEVVEVSPRAFQQDVAPNSQISATFNEAIRGPSVTESTFEVNGGDITGEYVVNGATVTLIPAQPLPRNANVTVKLSGIEDAAGNALAEDYSWTFTTGAGADTQGPSGIKALRVQSGGVTKNSVTLSWYAPGDDNTLGTATTYELRYLSGAACPMTPDNFGAGAQVAGLPAPAHFNASETFTVTGLTASTTYCFGIRAHDEVPNAGAFVFVENETGTSQSDSFVQTSTLDGIAPAAIALSVGTVAQTTAVLSWTAPGDDGATGTASSYELRYLTGESCPMTDENFASGTRVTLAAPQEAGKAETVTVTDLTPDAAHCFAIRATDDLANVSALSNSAPATTLEAIAPEAITDLTAASFTITSITMTWTAPGDDGDVGTAASYELRYLPAATCPVTPANFSTGTLVTTAAPQPPGTLESVTVGSLAQGQTYCFAILATDDAGNSSVLSQSVNGSTAEANPPAQIANLGSTLVRSTSLELTWTATGDDGAVGTAASYDLRYTTGASCNIDADNFATATAVTGEPAPGVAGTGETMRLTGLTADTRYCFAIVALDDVGNPSPVSAMHTVSTSAEDTVPPAAIADLAASSFTRSTARLTWTAPGDDAATGTVLAYEVRALSGTACAAPDFATAPVIARKTNPQSAGATETFDATNLSANTAHCFSVSALDESNEVASNVATGTTRRDPSADIAAVRAVIDAGAAPSHTIGDAVVSYVRSTGTQGLAGAADGPGFFLQSDPTGPAIFVALDPATFAGGVVKGDLLDLTVTGGTKFGNLLAINAASGSKVTGFTAPVPAAQDVSNEAFGAIPTGQWSYESELITLSGTVAAPFAGAGTGFSSAWITTAGTPTSNSNFRLRIPQTWVASKGLFVGCRFTVNATPAWRFSGQVQVSAWADADLTVVACPPVVTRVAPADGELVALNTSTVSVTFSQPMDVATLSAQTAEGTCTGTVQVSPNDFISCVAMTSATPVMTADGAISDAVATYTLAAALTPSANYKVKVTTAAAGASGATLENEFPSSFKAASAAPATLLINEVTPAAPTVNQDGVNVRRDFIEFYVKEGGSLAGLSFQQNIGGTPTTTVIKRFPDVIVATGDYVVLHAADDRWNLPADELTSMTQSAEGYASAWDFFANVTDLQSTDNTLHLLSGSTIVDAMLYGNNNGSWTGNAPAATATVAAGQWTTDLDRPFVEADSVMDASGAIVSTKSAKRLIDGTSGLPKDTNSKADWTVSSPLTIGAPN